MAFNEDRTARNRFPQPAESPPVQVAARKSRYSEEDVIEIKRGGAEVMTQIFTLVLCVAAAYTVFEGTKSYVPALQDRAIMAALAFCVEFFYFELLLTRYVYARLRAQLIALPLVVLPIVPIFFICTVPSIGYFGADLAIRAHMGRIANEGGEELTRLYTELKREGKLTPFLEISRAQYTELAKQERGGQLTGSAGRGAAAITIETVSKNIEQVARVVTESQRQVDEFYATAKRHHTNMLEILNKMTSVEAVTAKFTAEVDAFNAAITKLHAASAVESVAGVTSAIFAVGTFTTAASSPDAQIRDRQETAIGRVQQLVGETQQAIQRFTQEKAKAPKLRTYSATDAYAALFDVQNISWAVIRAYFQSASIDLFPLFAVAFLSWSVHERRRRLAAQRELGLTSATSA